MNITINGYDGVLEAVSGDNDVLNITFTYNDEIIEGMGWISAITNYYSPSDYDEDGNLNLDAQSREMTIDEIKQYCLDIISPLVPPEIEEVEQVEAKVVKWL